MIMIQEGFLVLEFVYKLFIAKIVVFFEFLTV